MKRIFILGLVLAGLFAPAARAYVVYTDSSGIYVETWNPGTIPMQIKLPTSPALIDGTNYASSVQAAMQVWNALLGTVQFSAQIIATPMNPPSGTYSTSSTDTHNEIVMDSAYGGMAFDANTLAITTVFTRGDSLVQADMVFNTAWNWDSYPTTLTGHGRTIDIRRVAVHELGHVFGLDHSQNVDAIMYYKVSDINMPQPDDIAGAQLLYGAPGFVPANNDFANATSINLTGSSIQLTGTNIAATRQSGEPAHAGANAPNGHSVWWKWTAPGSGSTTIDTLGSNFDTVLAVYTGSSVSALTAVASNDDAQSGVVRTSSVTFNAVSGTTYDIAVDGWGSVAQGDQFTLSGAITLNLAFSGTIVAAPGVVTQPADQAVSVGQTAQFSITASGNPAPSYQWQRLPAGGGSWANLSSGGSYGNTTTATLSVNNATGAMNGDEFRCVATNSAGSATSAPAMLVVLIAPFNAVITITVQ